MKKYHFISVMTTAPILIRCVLCQGTLPGVQDEVFLAHMRDHHRAFHNMDFMFAASFLTEENMEITKNFMNVTNNEYTLENDNSNNTNEETKFEEFKTEDINNIHENEEKKLQTPENYTKETNIEKEINVSKKRKRSVQIKIKEEKKSVKCQFCDKVLISQRFYDKHIQKKHTSEKARIKLTQNSPSKSCLCLFCGKEFPNPSSLRVHIQIVHDEEKHTCNLCGKEIKGIFKMDQHKKLFHKALEPCPHCGKMVKRLTQHIKTKHLENKEKKYQCQTCGKGFVRKSKFNDHERTHSKLKPFLCRVGQDECGHRSSLSGNRNKHEKLCKFNIMK